MCWGNLLAVALVGFCQVPLLIDALTLLTKSGSSKDKKSAEELPTLLHCLCCVQCSHESSVQHTWIASRWC